MSGLTKLNLRNITYTFDWFKVGMGQYNIFSVPVPTGSLQIGSRFPVPNTSVPIFEKIQYINQSLQSIQMLKKILFYLNNMNLSLL